MKKRIFIIDDEPDMVKAANDLLVADGYTVNACHHPDEGIRLLKKSPPDLLLLDIRMPDKDGFQVLREIKSDVKLRPIPVIMISVKSDETDVVVGLEIGAEDYIAKPYRKRELLARVKTVLRRHGVNDNEKTLTVGPIHLDYGRYHATLKKKNLDLTPKEFELLGFLLQRVGRVLTRSVISEAVWGNQFTGSTRTIDVHIDTLRKKLGPYARWIHSLKGVGYRFDPDV